MRKAACLFVLLLLLLLLVASPAFAADVTVSWEAPADDRVTGYIIYYGPNNPPAENEISVSGRNTTSVPVSNLDETTFVYFGAKSTGANGAMSSTSDIIQWKYEPASKTIYHLDRPGAVRVTTTTTTTTTVE